MVAHRALAARAARPSMRFERRTNCREATPWESWKRYTGRCSNYRRSRVVFLSTLFYAAIVVVCAYIHIYTYIYTHVHIHALFLISTLRRCELPLLSKRAHDRERFWSDFAPYDGSLSSLYGNRFEENRGFAVFASWESFLSPSLSPSTDVTVCRKLKRYVYEASCYSTCPRSFRTSSGHMRKFNKCILSKTNIVKDCYTIMPVRGVDHYRGNTSMRCLPKQSLTSNGIHEILTIILRVFKTRLTLKTVSVSRNFSYSPKHGESCIIDRKSLVL